MLITKCIKWNLEHRISDIFAIHFEQQNWIKQNSIVWANRITKLKAGSSKSDLYMAVRMLFTNMTSLNGRRWKCHSWFRNGSQYKRWNVTSLNVKCCKLNIAFFGMSVAMSKVPKIRILESSSISGNFVIDFQVIP